MCLREWLTQDSRCPTCKGIDQFPTMHRVLRMQLSNLIVKCNCNVELTYDELEKHASLCIKKEITCPLNCGETIKTKDEGHEHFKSCNNLLIQCGKCAAIYKRENQSHHKTVCLEEDETCDKCQLVFKKKEKAEHIEKCPEREDPCGKCSIVLKHKDKEAHELICEEHEMKCLRCKQIYLRKDQENHDCISNIMSQVLQMHEKVKEQNL